MRVSEGGEEVGGREAEEEEEEEGGYRTKNKNPTRQCGEQVPFKKPWRSHTTAILNCRTQKSATYYCRTHRFDAPVPMQKVSQHMQNTIAQHQPKKSQLQPSVTLRAQNEPDSTAKRRRPKPSRTRANFSLQRNLCVPEITPCFVQILTFKSHP